MAKIEITPRVMTIDNDMISIANITQVGLKKNISHRSDARKNIIISIVIIFLCVVFHIEIDSNTFDHAALVGMFGGIVLLVRGIIRHRARYVLFLQTTAGRITPLEASDKGLMEEVKNELYKAISHENPNQHYNIINSAIGNTVGKDINIIPE